jgi:hypothetical protein
MRTIFAKKGQTTMQIVSHHETRSPAIPRTLARALRRVAARDGVPVSVTIKRQLTDALIAEGEIEVTREATASRGSILVSLTTSCRPLISSWETPDGQR